MNLQEILANLVAIPSVSGKEDVAAAYIAQFVQTNTPFRAERIERNVVVRVAGKDSSKCLVFNGHIDTVEPGDRNLWETDPLELTEEDGKLYGLGTSDMKGGVAVMLFLLSGMADKKPACDVLFTFVVDEETTGAGTHETLGALAAELAEYETCSGIIAEPTDGKIAIGHRGNIFAEVTFTGEGSHASTPPEADKQAIIAASTFVQSIPEEISRWQSLAATSDLGDTTIAATAIEAGDHASANQVPTSCTVRLDIRTNELLYGQVPTLLQKWAARHDATAKIISQCGYGYCAADEPIIKAAQAASGNTETITMPSSTDQCFFTEQGIPAIICGPGEHACIHAPNEYISKAALEESVEYFSKLLDDLASK